MSNDSVNFSLKMPRDLASAIESYAVSHGISKSATVCRYIRLGMQADSGSAPATREDIAALSEQLKALSDVGKAQTIALIDSMKKAVETASAKALDSGRGELRESDSIRSAVEAVERSAEREIEARVEEAVASTRLQMLDDAKSEADAEIERKREAIEAYGYRRALDEFKSASLLDRIFCRVK